MSDNLANQMESSMSPKAFDENSKEDELSKIKTDDEIKGKELKGETLTKLDSALSRFVKKVRQNTQGVRKTWKDETVVDESQPTDIIKKSYSGNDISIINDHATIDRSIYLRQKTAVPVMNEFNDTDSPLVFCESCNSYKDQLQSLKIKIKAQENNYNKLNEEYQTNITMKETKDEMISKLNNTVTEHENTISTLFVKYNNLNEFCDRLRTAYERFRDSSDRELKNILNERCETKKKIDRIESAYEHLLGVRDKKAADMEAEKIDLPTDIETAQFNLLSLKEEIIQMRCANEHLNDKVQNLEMFIKDKERADITERETTFEEYNNDRKELQSKVELLTIELNADRLKLKALEGLDETDRILKIELDTIKTNYSHLDNENLSLKNKSLALQQELENSESVQQDFVRLSQTLQIQLESIRQEEKELRWQFKEDVKVCNDCHLDVRGHNNRNKYHCKHCGKIFCKLCVSEIQAATNGRKANVCKVCHTMLVKDAVPYFSLINP